MAKKVGRGPKKHYDRDGILALEGDMREVLAAMEGESFTGCVTDPPYGLSTYTAKHTVDRIYQTFLDIGFPDIYQTISELPQKSGFPRVPLGGAPLRWVNWPVGVGSRVGVPECSVDLQSDTILEEEINQPREATSRWIANKRLSPEPDSSSPKFLGDFVLKFGDAPRRTSSNPPSRRYAEAFSDGFAMPIVAASSTCSPGSLRCGASVVYRDDVIGFIDDTLRQAKAAASVLAFPRTVNTIMLRFDLRGRPRELRATHRTGKFNSLTVGCGPSLIRTHATTRSLSSVAESHRVRVVFPAAHGTDSSHWLHVWTPPSSIVTNVIPRGGFMGKSWDSTLPDPECWCEIYRVLKPGAFLLAFGGTRTFHRMACAVEDAGFVVRDTVMWMYGQGFPKGYDVSKGIDKKLGMRRKVSGKGSSGKTAGMQNLGPSGIIGGEFNITAPASPEATLWSGWNVALKPAWEPIIVAMKPCDGGFAENAMKHGVAGLNVDGGRIGTEERIFKGMSSKKPAGAGTFRDDNWRPKDVTTKASGRWPANVILSHDSRCVCVGARRVKTGTAIANTNGQVTKSYDGGLKNRQRINEGYADADGREQVELYACVPGCPVRILDEQSGVSKSSGRSDPRAGNALNGYGTGDSDGWSGNWSKRGAAHDDTGTASRFFYTAKASTAERDGGLSSAERNLHPTVKSIDLMRYLLTLVTMPENTRILDPFMGSGSTLVAAKQLGLECVGVDNDPESCRTAAARLSRRTSKGISKRKKLRPRRRK